eukprot:5703597-Karenia_brevis.AAC.1
MLAGSVLERLALKLNLESYAEITVEADEHLDFTDFDVRKHSGVVLDGIGDARALKPHRETLQGRPKETKGARSATMKH